jgi:diguanylate cyclase (GGDEF)-like protein
MHMRRWRLIETAAGQGALLFLAAGVLGLLAEATPSTPNSPGTIDVYVGSLLVGIVIAVLPWDRWPARMTLVIVAPALGLIVSGQWANPHGTATLYGVWFVVLFGWVGSWHAARTSLAVAPIAAVAYVLPFLPGAPAASADALSTVIVAIPIGLVLAEVLAAKATAMRRAQNGLESAAVLLQRASLTDDLTGVGNRRQANALLDSMVPGDGLVLVDLDHFKLVNDTLGHAEGDRVLMRLGAYLRTAVRDADAVARFGGEEFLIVLRGASGNLVPTVERLLDGWRRDGVLVTLSAGAVLHIAGREPTATFKAADDLLYRAKADGRDRVAALIDGLIDVRTEAI